MKKERTMLRYWMLCFWSGSYIFDVLQWFGKRACSNETDRPTHLNSLTAFLFVWFSTKDDITGSFFLSPLLQRLTGITSLERQIMFFFPGAILTHDLGPSLFHNLFMFHEMELIFFFDFFSTTIRFQVSINFSESRKCIAAMAYLSEWWSLFKHFSRINDERSRVNLQHIWAWERFRYIIWFFIYLDFINRF